MLECRNARMLECRNVTMKIMTRKNIVETQDSRLKTIFFVLILDTHYSKK